MNYEIDLNLVARKRKLLLLGDLLPALLLIMAGVTNLQNGNNLPLALANLISGILVLIFGIREWRISTKSDKYRVQWYDVISGLVMIVNAANLYKPWKGFQPAYIYALLSIFLMLKGFSVIKFNGFRKLIVSDEGFTIRTGFSSKLTCAWNEVKNILLDNNVIIIVTDNGEHKISLRNIENKKETYEALISSLRSIKK